MGYYDYSSAVSGVGGGSSNASDVFSYTKEAPAYKTPEYDLSRINFLAQQQAAPQLSSLRRGLQQGMSQYYDNPAERGAAERSRLEGYGYGLGGVMSGATSAAQGLYGQEYAGLENEADSTYKGAYETWTNDRESAYQAWLADQAAKTAATTAATTPKTNTINWGSANQPLTTKTVSSPPSWEKTYGPSEIIYGAGSEAAWREAMGYTSPSTGRTY